MTRQRLRAARAGARASSRGNARTAAIRRDRARRTRRDPGRGPRGTRPAEARSMTLANPAAVSTLLTPSPPGSKPVLARLIDALVMGLFPILARALGYTFRVGTDPELARDARAVLHAVWSK